MEPTPYEITILQTLEALLEATMRVYDSNLAIISVIEGDRALMDRLRAQHAEGKYYFPPFALTENRFEADGDSRHDSDSDDNVDDA